MLQMAHTIPSCFQNLLSLNEMLLGMPGFMTEGMR